MIEIEKEETDRGRLVGNLERLLVEGKILLKYLWQLSNILVMLRCAPEFERPGSGGEVSNEDINILCSMQNFFFFRDVYRSGMEGAAFCRARAVED